MYRKVGNDWDKKGVWSIRCEDRFELKDFIGLEWVLDIGLKQLTGHKRMREKMNTTSKKWKRAHHMWPPNHLDQRTSLDQVNLNDQTIFSNDCLRLEESPEVTAPSYHFEGRGSSSSSSSDNLSLWILIIWILLHWGDFILICPKSKIKLQVRAGLFHCGHKWMRQLFTQMHLMIHFIHSPTRIHN